jgi:hypothetical protein
MHKDDHHLHELIVVKRHAILQALILAVTGNK